MYEPVTHKTRLHRNTENTTQSSLHQKRHKKARSCLYLTIFSLTIDLVFSYIKLSRHCFLRKIIVRDL